MNKKQLPIKILQFGEGNFLRAFVDWMIQKANDQGQLNAGIAIVQPLSKGLVPNLKAQDCQYNVILEGIKEGAPIREIQKIDCVMDAVNPYSEYEQYKSYFLSPDLEFVISNTTEAGIVKVEGENISALPPASFPGKVVALLLERYKKYDGATDKGLTFICCELIENNASTLKKIVLELANKNNLGDHFTQWIEASCSFCNSLVDRIVTGFPKDTIAEVQQELSEEDNMVVTAEYFHLWGIEGNEAIKQRFPLHKAGLNVQWLEDLKPFRDKKVRILNGAHTALVPLGLLAGYATVKEAFADKAIESLIRTLIAQEVLPNISGSPEELATFAKEILDRFFNPYIKHYLKDISLNSISKWVTRDLPSFSDSYQRTGKIPQHLAFSLAALIELYVGDNDFEANDSHPLMGELNELWEGKLELCKKVSTTLANAQLWSQDMTLFTGLEDAVCHNLKAIRENGVLSAIKDIN